MIFTNFAKAFDRVDLAILMDVLFKSSFGEPILSCLKSYLSNRVQWAKVLGFKSEAVNVLSAVSQGGHYSPLLFSLFVNEINNAVQYCKFFMFAEILNFSLQ